MKTTEFEHDDLLIDHIQFDELLEYRIDLNLLSTRPRNALKRALWQSEKWKSHSEQIDEIKQSDFVRLQDISQLRISDVRDLTHIGESTLIQLIQELQIALSQYSQNQEVLTNSNKLDSLEEMRLRISIAQTIEELTESMIAYQKSIRSVTEREEKIWRNRLPWITDKPRTLDAIGVELGLTRERIRQIQRKSSRYAYGVEAKVFVLSEVQNILLGCTNFEEFREAMIEEKITKEESITLGRIRHLAVELNQYEVVSDIEKAIYTWSQGFSLISD